MHGSEKLIIFTRFPVAGEAKTRLIPALGAEGAAALQREMTEHTVRQARKTRAEIEIRFTGGSEQQMRDWLGDDLQYADQGGGDLGERMACAFQEHFDSGAQRVVIIGCDCPSNDWKNIQKSFQWLETNDCVIGPASDGGYYLIGLRRPMPELFQGLEWGTDTVFEQTLALAAGKPHLLKRLHDVDRPEDLPPKISVIIPTLNEAECILQTLEKVNEGFRVECIVADGGSTDGTRAVVPDCLICLDGRAAQQNLGAKAASGEILLFLHADTILPEGWEWTVRETLADSSVALGAFSFRVNSNFPGRKFIEDATNWRSRVCKMPYGDQGIFLRKETFEATGGFPDLPIMEDYAFVRTLRRRGKIVTVPEPAITSVRRWRKHGVLKVTLINKLMILGYHLCIPPERLATFYRGRSR